MTKVLLGFGLLALLSGCIGGSGKAVVYGADSGLGCVNRSDLRNTDGAPLARICGENPAYAGQIATNTVAATDPSTSSNDFVRNEAMYRAGNNAMVAMALAR